MARPRTGERQWRVRLQTWVGRVRDETGKRGSWTDLGTDDDAAAQERLERWIATGEAPSQAGKEPFASASERVMTGQEKSGFKGAKERRYRVAMFANPRIGHIALERLEQHHLYGVLTGMGEQGYSESTVHHMRTDFGCILGALMLGGAVAQNVARDLPLPDDLEIDDRSRIVLTDEEVMRFRRRGFERELDMMALISRELGGMRTSDLHAFDWGDVDKKTWLTALVRRPKTDGEGRGRKRKGKGRRRSTRAFERVKHVIPESVAGPLGAWWRAHGSPIDGPVFPVRRGPKAGQRKVGKGISYAQALRDALWAEGITRPLPGFESAQGDERRLYCALQVETDETLPVDFHSFRRGYVTALANSGVNAQTAMALSGHTDMKTHARYYSPQVLAAPAAALPGSAQPAPVPMGETVPAPAAAAGLTAEVLDALRLLLAGTQGAPPAAPAAPPVPAAPVAPAAPAAPVAALAIDPGRGANPAHTEANAEHKAEQFRGAPGKIRTSDLRFRRPLETSRESPFDAFLDTPERANVTLSDVGLTHDAGQTARPPTLLDQLRATAHAAVEAGNWATLAALQPLIDAEQKRAAATAPVSLDLVRAKREGK